MGVISTALKHLLQAGLTGDGLLAAIEEIETALLAQTRRIVFDAQAERRRMHDRERKLVTQDIRLAVMERDGYACVYCACREGPFHIDHVDPLSQGGMSDFDNLALACETCNLRKGGRTPQQWRGYAWA